MKPNTTFTSSSSVSYSSDPDWAWLPKNLLYMVLNKLMLLSEMINFSTVCTNWRSVAKDRFHQLNLRPHMSFNRNLPMLLIPSIENNDYIRSLHNVNHGEIYDLRLEVPYKKRCCGSSHGWLINVDDDSFKVTVSNPFYFGNSMGVIHLPQFSAALDMDREIGVGFNFEYFIYKAILSSDPISSPSDFAVMVIYGMMRKLAFWKPGAESWTYITWSLPRFFDVVHSQGYFIAVNTLGQVCTYEIDDEANPPYDLCAISAPLFSLLGNRCRRYIIELPDKTILQVIRIVKTSNCARNGPMLNSHFFVYKMVIDEKYDWIAVENLEDGALFLGDNYSHYVSVSRFPGCRPNSIYFTGDHYVCDAMNLNPHQLTGSNDIGVYLLEDKTVKRYHHPIPEQSHLPPPIWILPTI